MNQLKKAKTKLVNAIRKEVPASWAVAAPRGQEYVEIDQDGERPSHRFPAVGSMVIRIEDATEGVTVSLFKRVRCMPGYAETRKSLGVIATGTGQDWQNTIHDAVTGKVQELGELELQ